VSHDLLITSGLLQVSASINSFHFIAKIYSILTCNLFALKLETSLKNISRVSLALRYRSSRGVSVKRHKVE
jgi:hypothetical protein